MSDKKKNDSESDKKEFSLHKLHRFSHHKNECVVRSDRDHLNNEMFKKKWIEMKDKEEELEKKKKYKKIFGSEEDPFLDPKKAARHLLSGYESTSRLNENRSVYGHPEEFYHEISFRMEDERFVFYAYGDSSEQAEFFAYCKIVNWFLNQ